MTIVPVNKPYQFIRAHKGSIQVYHGQIDSQNGAVTLLKIIRTIGVSDVPPGDFNPGNDGIQVFGVTICGEKLRELHQELLSRSLTVNCEGICFIYTGERDFQWRLGDGGYNYRLCDHFNWSKYGVVPSTPYSHDNDECKCKKKCCEEIKKELKACETKFDEKEKELCLYRKKLEKKERKIYQFEKCLEEKNQKLRDGELEVLQKKKEISHFEKLLEEKNNKLRDFELKLEEKKREICVLVKSLTPKHEGLNDYKLRLQKKEKELLQYRMTLKWKDKELNDYKMKLKAKEIEYNKQIVKKQEQGKCTYQLIRIQQELKLYKSRLLQKDMELQQKKREFEFKLKKMNK